MLFWQLSVGFSQERKLFRQGKPREEKPEQTLQDPAVTMAFWLSHSNVIKIER
jgi:hypothetical protein